MSFLRSRAFQLLLAAIVACGLASGAGAVWFYYEFLGDLPDLRRIEDYSPSVTSVVLDRNGKLIGEFYHEQRRLVQIDEIPEHVKQAFISAEDSSFYEHKGLDYTSIIRAALANLRAGGAKKQGASTITQQMVKSLLLSPEKTFRRKIREMILSRRIEQHFTKDEILYLYLNQIYFGHGAWGIGQAARGYFGKDVAELTVGESALLAGLPQRPTDYSPYRDPESAERRRQYVLGRLLADGYIEGDVYEDAIANPPEIREHADEESMPAAAHFTELVRRYLFERLGGDRVLNEGLVIETTLDLDLQIAAVEALRTGLEAHDKRQGYRGPIRRVPAAEIPAELEKLAEENAEWLAVPEEEEDTPLDGTLNPLDGTLNPLDGTVEELEAKLAKATDAGLQTEPVAEAIAAELQQAEIAELEAGANTDANTDSELDGEQLPAGPILPFDEPLVGVVLAVDRSAGTARIGFAPDVEGLVRLPDVEWAREVQPKRRSRPVKQITKVFSKGDVTRFVRLPDYTPEERLELFGEEPAADEEYEGEEQGATPAEPVRLGLFQRPIVQGALLSLDTASGEVRSLVGGYDYERSEFNRAVQALRQPGSAFKPFIYGAALEKGYTPVSEVVDRPVVYTDPVSGFVWAPRNYGRQFYGPIPMRNALKKSINNATVHLFRDVGVDFVIDYARRFGIQSPLSRDLSLALGSSSVTLLELTTAYAVYPNGGRRVVPLFIKRVTQRDGQVLLEDLSLGKAPPPVLKPLVAEGDAEVVPYPDGEIMPTDRVVSEAAAYLMCDLLRAVVEEGTGRRLKRLGRVLAGKTGTTNEQGDAWFMGFSPEITTGVWVGHDDNSVLGFGETGAGAALPIWGDYMKVALAERPRSDFDVPREHIVFQRIDRNTGLIADAANTDAYFQPFIEGTEPTRSVSDRESVTDARRALRDDIF
jgi:penicillin-binding protein 1A